MEPIKKSQNRKVNYNNFLDKYADVYEKNKTSSQLRIRKVQNKKSTNNQALLSEEDSKPKKQKKDRAFDQIFDSSEKEEFGAEFIKKITKKKRKDFDTIRRIEAKINLNEQSLNSLSILLPNLEFLKLNKSNITNFSQLGTDFSKIRVIWMSQCKVKRLDSLDSFSNLEELYCSFNFIEDIPYYKRPITRLKILDLEANKLNELDKVEGLECIPKLEELNLKDNQVTSVSGFKSFIMKACPLLQLLDDTKIEMAIKQSRKQVSKKSKQLTNKKCFKEDFDLGAQNFMDRLDSTILGRMIDRDELQVDELLQELLQKENALMEPDNEDLLFDNCRQSSIFNEDTNLEQETGEESHTKIYGNTAKMIKERRKEAFVQEDDKITKSKNLSQIMDNFGYKKYKKEAENECLKEIMDLENELLEETSSKKDAGKIQKKVKKPKKMSKKFLIKKP